MKKYSTFHWQTSGERRLIFDSLEGEKHAASTPEQKSETTEIDPGNIAAERIDTLEEKFKQNDVVDVAEGINSLNTLKTQVLSPEEQEELDKERLAEKARKIQDSPDPVSAIEKTYDVDFKSDVPLPQQIATVIMKKINEFFDYIFKILANIEDAVGSLTGTKKSPEKQLKLVDVEIEAKQTQYDTLSEQDKDKPKGVALHMALENLQKQKKELEAKIQAKAPKDLKNPEHYAKEALVKKGIQVTRHTQVLRPGKDGFTKYLQQMQADTSDPMNAKLKNQAVSHIVEFLAPEGSTDKESYFVALDDEGKVLGSM